MEFGIIKAMFIVEQRAPQSGVNIFLPSIFLSCECFCWMILPCRPEQTTKAKTEI